MSTKYPSISALEENSRDIYIEVTDLLMDLIVNILYNPTIKRFRKLRLSNRIVSEKLMTSIGAMECLFEIGFQENGEFLILPDNAPLNILKAFLTEISMRRNMLIDNNELLNRHETSRTCIGNGDEENTDSTDQTDDSSIEGIYENSFLQEIVRMSRFVQCYENSNLIQKAYSYIPVKDLLSKAKSRLAEIQKYKDNEKTTKFESIGIQECLLLELLNWFKESFFEWVDSPECSLCSNSGPTLYEGSFFKDGIQVEIFKCSECDDEVYFPRHTDPFKLLETRKGRCGEWANCFTLFCRAMKWDSRYVVDRTDHVWTEVYSVEQKRWLHCDPCENVCDSPLMYEAGWGKKISYVLAYSREGVQDVTWRYTSHHKDVLKRRNLCSERELLSLILKIRKRSTAKISAEKKLALNQSILMELIEMLGERKPSTQEIQCRSSGSLAWRLKRGEAKIETVVPYVWRPTREEKECLHMNVGYSIKEDKYLYGRELKLTKPGFQNGVFSLESIFRKEEKDWKMVYLAREEGSIKGKIQWRFDFSPELVVDKVDVVLKSEEFENGRVSWILCSSKVCELFPVGNIEISLKAFEGSSSLTLTAELTEGKGALSWQHAQLFRQSTRLKEDLPFLVSITLKRP